MTVEPSPRSVPPSSGLRRSALKRKTPLARATTRLAQKPACRGCRTTVNPESKRRLREKPLRARVREQVKARDGGCVARDLVPEVQCRLPLDVHEILARSQGGDYLDPEAAVAICRAHHDWVGLNKDQATALGLRRSLWETRR